MTEDLEEWDGVTERRKLRSDGREGRRPSDQHCPQHHILWKHHDEDKEKFRDLSCGKISKLGSELKSEVEKLEKADTAIRDDNVGKFWFRIVIGFLGVGIASLYLQNKEILVNIKEVSSIVSKQGTSLAEQNKDTEYFKSELLNLTKRQDFLRDQSVRHIEEYHKKGP